MEKVDKVCIKVVSFFMRSKCLVWSWNNDLGFGMLSFSMFFVIGVLGLRWVFCFLVKIRIVILLLVISCNFLFYYFVVLFFLFEVFFELLIYLCKFFYFVCGKGFGGIGCLFNLVMGKRV